MDAGRLSQRITIERATTTRDAYGDVATVWEIVASVWCEVIQSGIREFLAGSTDVSEEKALFRVRFPLPAKVLPVGSDRLIWRGDAWNIQGCSVIAPLGEAQISATKITGTDGR